MAMLRMVERADKVNTGVLRGEAEQLWGYTQIQVALVMSCRGIAESTGCNRSCQQLLTDLPGGAERVTASS